MEAPDGLVVLTAFASFLAAIAASMIVSVRSIARGDTLFREWCKRGFFGLLAMTGVWLIFLIVGTIASAVAQ
jgi:hypothetical protein